MYAIYKQKKYDADYEVLSEVPVLKGKIAPWFEQIGGGTQSRLILRLLN